MRSNVERLNEYSRFIYRTLRSPEFIYGSSRQAPDTKRSLVDASSDVLVLHYAHSTDLFSLASLEGLEPVEGLPVPDTSLIKPYTHFTYSHVWENLTAKLATRLSPYIAIHWRMETMPSERMPPCAESLLESLKHIKAAYPQIQNVYLATDYPVEQLEQGLESESGHSGTMHIFPDQHRAVQRLLDAFSSGEMGDLQLTTFEREARARRITLEDGSPLQVADMENGILGIVDKSMAINADFFLAGAPKKCARDSSYTQQITDERILMIQGLDERPDHRERLNMINVGFFPLLVVERRIRKDEQYWATSQADLDQESQVEWDRLREKFDLPVENPLIASNL